jgi:spermidine synthase
MEEKKEVYREQTWPEFGVEHHLHNTIIRDSIHTFRGTFVEIVERPQWGLSCYMDNSIQSCEADEKIYHETLVHPAMTSVPTPRRVLIFGGGEGATAREVLKWPSVERVDMYEWDEQVVQLFKSKYPQWAQGAWNDPRLHIFHTNAFDVIQNEVPAERYDVIIIDLFEPSDDENSSWYFFLTLLRDWVSDHGSIVMYSGIRNLFSDRHPDELLNITGYSAEASERGYQMNNLSVNRLFVPYKVFIPSYSGESMFLLMKHENIIQQWDQLGVQSHITRDIWNSYKTWNSFT